MLALVSPRVPVTPVGAAGAPVGSEAAQPMSCSIATATAPGECTASCAPIDGVISEYAFPSGYAVSSRCAPPLLPCCHVAGAYIVGMVPPFADVPFAPLQ